MAKRRKPGKRATRTRKQRRLGQKPRAAVAGTHVPSAASFFRFSLLDFRSSTLMDKAAALLKPSLWARDGEVVRQIERAETVEELLDLVHVASGLGEPAWQERMRQFGPQAVPMISERLEKVREIPDRDVRSMTVEKLIGALRWQGDAGAQALLACFDALGDYGRGQACVVLGLLGARSAADTIWRFYQKAVRDRREDHFVGALWGLIDLGDERVGGALADLLEQGRDFCELYGFLSLAGDAGTVVPLLSKVARETRENEQASMALVSMVHRLGKEAFVAELAKVSPPEEPVRVREAFAERFLSVPESEAREYFGWFYRGLTSEDLARLFGGRA